MKSLLLFLLSPLLGYSQLVVEVKGVKSNEGQIGLVIFSSAKGFPEDRSSAAYQKTYAAKKGKMMFQVPELPKGPCAFVILHDANKNDKFDKSFVGYPKEGFAISNQKKLGRPKFKKAVVDHPGPLVTLKMLYP